MEAFLFADHLEPKDSSKDRKRGGSSRDSRFLPCAVLFMSARVSRQLRVYILLWPMPSRWWPRVQNLLLNFIIFQSDNTWHWTPPCEPIFDVFQLVSLALLSAVVSRCVLQEQISVGQPFIFTFTNFTESSDELNKFYRAMKQARTTTTDQ